MDNPSKAHTNTLGRHLAQLKLVSRLLGYELHNQAGSKAISLSRDEVVEIQTTLDLFIEEASKRASTGRTGGGLGVSESRMLSGGTNLSGPEGTLLPTRN